MTATQGTSSASRNPTYKVRAQTSATHSGPCLDALDHLDTAESIILTVLRRMESEDDWGPEQTTLMVGIEFLSRAAQSIRHHVDKAPQSK